MTAVLKGAVRTKSLAAVRTMMSAIGEDVTREGLLETPDRVVRAWGEWFSGYHKDPNELFKSFEDGAERADEIVLLTNCAVHSHCVVGSTFVDTPRGRVPIMDLRHGDWIYTVDPKTMELSLVRCHHPRITQRDAALVRVLTDNDTVLCTPDHRFLLTSGEWVQAQHLTNGMRLCSLYKGSMKAGTTEAPTYYPTVLSSRYTRHAQGLKIYGRSDGHVPEHRFVCDQMEDLSARPGVRVVHHADEVVWNNVPENVSMMSISEHNKMHRRTQLLANSAVRKAAAAEASGRPEVREKRSSSAQAHWDSMTPEDRVARGAATSAGKQKRYAEKNHVVFGVERLDRREDVWCMTVPGTQTFFANGMAVHNCEHHITPIVGFAHVAYIPNGKIVGISKLARVVDIFSRRLQVQERLTNQIADCIQDNLNPAAVAVIITAKHFCMATRGVQQPLVDTTTSAMRGAFREEASARAELLSLIHLATKA